MKTNASLLLVLAMLLSMLACQGLHAEEKPFEGDGLGKLTLGQKDEEVLLILGKPESKGISLFWEATAEWVQEWQYAAHGLSVKMATPTKAGRQAVLAITAFRACPLATKRGIKIGSTEAEVRRAYKDVESTEESKAGETFVAGSIYGGVIFTFKKGKVSEIFIGAAAE